MTNPLNGFLTFMFGAMTFMGGYCCYIVGDSDGAKRVVADCVYYGKHALSGTQELLCSAVVQPEELMPKPYVPYTKEEKDSTKHQRK